MSKEQIQNALYVVSSPIGNLDDITLRAINILSTVDIIASEDTRNTGNLLKHYNIRYNKLESYHEHNESEKSLYLLNEIKNGKSVALLTDAGTPCISDPGYRIIRTAVESGVKVIPLPGATAFVPALVASGLAVNQFRFVGFPPQKKGRQTFLKKALSNDCTIIMYESPHRLMKLVDEIIEICGESRKACIAREITKQFEEFTRGSLLECKQYFEKKGSIKGEFVVIIEGAE